MKRVVVTGLALLLSATGASLVRADEVDASDLRGALDAPIVSTASKTAEADAVSPATSTVITSEQLQRYGMHTVGEALSFLSMGVVGESVQGIDADEYGARGVGITGDVGSHFLVLVNGHAVNSPTAGATQLNSDHAASVWFGRALGIPLEMIDHIEVMLGPGSVLYGSNAMLGIINVVTKRADASPGIHVVGESQLFTAGRGFVGAGYTFSLFGAPSEITAGVEVFGQRGPDLYFAPQGPPQNAWGGTAHNIGTDVQSAVLRLNVGNFEFNGRATMKDANLPVAGQGASSFDQASAHERERRVSFDVKYRIPVSAVVDLSARLYWDASDFLADYTYVVPVDVLSVGTSYWGRAEVQSAFDWLKSGRFVTLLGAETLYVHDSALVTSGDGSGATSIITHMSREVAPLAAYAQQTWQPNRWLALNGGVRVDYDHRFAPVASPRLAASIKTWQGATLKFIYSEAFRAPALDESYQSWKSTRIASVGLVPETVRSVETTMQQDFGAQHLRFGVFYSEWQNLIYLHTFTAAEGAAGIGPTGYAQAQNRGTIWNPGFNGSFDGSLAEGSLSYGMTLTGTVAEVNGGGSLPVAPRMVANAHLAYDLPGTWPVLAFAGYFVGPRRAAVPFQSAVDPDTLPIVPSQVTLRPTVSGPVPGVAGLTYRASANFVLASHDPYLVGPNSINAPNASQLTPIERFRATVGLAYAF